MLWLRIALASAVMLAGCDVITPPYTRTVAADSTGKDTGFVRYRKVLVEEFTGAQCTNCPNGHRRLAQLAAAFGDSIVIVSIHAGEFARPDPKKGYTADFRTEAGEELNSQFRVALYPAAVINRTRQEDGSFVVGALNWGSVIANQLRTTTPIALRTTAECDTVLKRLRLTVAIEATADVSFPLNVGYYIIEDSIVAPQLDNGTYVPNYVHRHVLRAAPLGAYGETLGTLQSGARIERSYSYDLGNATWNPAHLEVVVFIARPAPDYTVIQCDGRKCGMVAK